MFSRQWFACCNTFYSKRRCSGRDTTAVELIVFADGGDSVTAFAAQILLSLAMVAAISEDQTFRVRSRVSTSVRGFLRRHQGSTIRSGKTFSIPGNAANPSFGLLEPEANSVTLNGSELFRFSVDTSTLTAGESIQYTFDYGSSIGAGPWFYLVRWRSGCCRKWGCRFGNDRFCDS